MVNTFKEGGRGHDELFVLASSAESNQIIDSIACGFRNILLSSLSLLFYTAAAGGDLHHGCSCDMGVGAHV